MCPCFPCSSWRTKPITQCCHLWNWHGSCIKGRLQPELPAGCQASDECPWCHLDVQSAQGVCWLLLCCPKQGHLAGSALGFDSVEVLGSPPPLMAKESFRQLWWLLWWQWGAH